MSITPLTPSQQQDQFARLIAARLSAGAAELPHGVRERLRAARVQAVARRKRASVRAVSSVAASGAAGLLTFGNEGRGLWNRIASVLPLVGLAAGLILIHTFEDERRANEVAEVDAALLTDDLPPSAYADSGFVQFLKSSQD